MKLFSDSETEENKLNALKYTTLITAGLSLIFLAFKGNLFDFVGFRDGQYIQAYGQNFINAIKEDRKAIFTADTLRTLILVILSAGLIWMFLKKKLTQNLVIVVFAVLIVFDLVTVGRRYVNNDDFVSAIQVQKPYQATAADLEILKDKSHYRVFDLTTSNTKPSYFHNSLNGYHAAKMKRYNELFDFYISKNHMGVLNMLNTKYIIAQGEDGQPQVFNNPDANGNAWFVEKLAAVETANVAIKTLDSLNTKSTAIVESVWIYDEKNDQHFQVDSLVSISLVDYKPNYLKYTSNNSNDGFAVFSENYYGEGWQAYIDGVEAAHVRVNYVLRGMEIPAGNHSIEFKFEPQVIKTGSGIALSSTIVLVLLIVGGLFYEFKKK